MEKPKLRLVEEQDREPAKVVPIARALGYAATLQSLPDNVFLLRPSEPQPPEAA